VNTSSNKNDCLSHSFLIDVSPNFRRLNQQDKNAYADWFRRSAMPTYYTESEKTNPSNEFDLIDTERFLTDLHAEKLARTFNVNIIVFQRVSTSVNAVELCCDKNQPTIVIYNPGDLHFRGVRRKRDNKYLFTREEGNEIVTKYMSTDLEPAPAPTSKRDYIARILALRKLGQAAKSADELDKISRQIKKEGEAMRKSGVSPSAEDILAAESEKISEDADNYLKELERQRKKFDEDEAKKKAAAEAAKRQEAALARPPPVQPPHKRIPSAQVPAPKPAAPPTSPVQPPHLRGKEQKQPQHIQGLETYKSAPPGSRLAREMERQRGKTPTRLYGRDVGATEATEKGLVGQIIKKRNIDGRGRKGKRKNIKTLD
jgi:hypothetical protein